MATTISDNRLNMFRIKSTRIRDADGRHDLRYVTGLVINYRLSKIRRCANLNE
jgi:hypothetical protein